MALLICSKETFPIEEVTKRQIPTGGVDKPIIKFKTAITAKWIGSTPTDTDTFNNIGNKMTNAAIVSINVPTNSKSILIKRSIIYLLFVIDKKKLAICWGICSLAKIQPKTLAKPTRIIIDEVEIIVLIKILFKSCILRSRKKNPMKKIYNDATIEASVGVKTPPKIPKRINGIVNKGRIFFLNIKIIFGNDDLLPFG